MCVVCVTVGELEGLIAWGLVSRQSSKGEEQSVCVVCVTVGELEGLIAGQRGKAAKVKSKACVWFVLICVYNLQYATH